MSTLEDAFAPLMEADPAAFRGKFRTMASDPHAFYRGSACVFYADVTGADDPFADEESSRIWVHGDLHVENFGTYLNSDGILVFDVNDFDEAYLGHFTWDLQRFAASLALVGWQKALPEEDVRRLIGRYVRAYLSQVDEYEDSEEDDDFALAPGQHRRSDPRRRWSLARRMRRADLLDGVRRCGRAGTGGSARTRPPVDSGSGSGPRWSRPTRPTWRPSRAPSGAQRAIFYDLRDLVGKTGFGIGSAGLPAYNLLIEGVSQALDNDVAAVDEAGQRACGEPLRRQRRRGAVLRARGPPHRGEPAGAAEAHRSAARATRSSTASGYVVAEISPYEVDLDWGNLTEPDEIAAVVEPARPRHREDPLRLRRGQRRGPGGLPGRVGDPARRCTGGARSSRPG